MHSLYDLPAPAKLNLFLHIVGRRDDGMHLLQSAFMLVDWHDRIHMELRANSSLSREDANPAAPCVVPADDLCLRAALALQHATGCTQGVHITLDKQIPAQAGMGGGSSDAATCLLALNRLWNLRLSRSQLQHIGLRLGADVPFFLAGTNAWVEGVGERITPLVGTLALPSTRFVVVKPRAGLDTARIFRDPALTRDCDAAIITGFAANPFGFGCNVLQKVAERLCPEVNQALTWLQSQGLQARMTGSGSAVFAQIPSHQTVMPSPDPGWTVRLCSNMEVHPLAGWAFSDDS